MADWQTATTPQGQTYYYNSATGETRWDPPGTPGGKNPAMPPPAAPVKSAGAPVGRRVAAVKGAMAGSITISKSKLLLISAAAAFVLITFVAVIATAAAGGYADTSPMNFEMNLAGVPKANVELNDVRNAVAQLVGTTAANVAVVELENIDAGSSAGGCKAVVRITPSGGLSRDHVTQTLTLADANDDGKGDDLAKEEQFKAVLTAAGIKGCTGCSCAPVATVPVAGVGSGSTPASSGSTACVAAKSLPADCTRCLDSNQCVDGAFCCPSMKTCISSSRQGCRESARSSPDYPDNWQLPTCAARRLR